MPKDFCVKCDPPPTGQGYHVQVQGMYLAEGGPILHWRVRIVDLASGEVLFSKEPMERDDARGMALRISENIVGFLESMGW